MVYSEFHLLALTSMLYVTVKLGVQQKCPVMTENTYLDSLRGQTAYLQLCQNQFGYRTISCSSFSLFAPSSRMHSPLALHKGS